MDFTYSFGYPNVQRTLAIAEAISNSHTGEKYQVDYRGKYRPLPVIEVPIELFIALKTFVQKVCKNSG